jgi:hypothetical protein
MTKEDMARVRSLIGYIHRLFSKDIGLEGLDFGNVGVFGRTLGLYILGLKDLVRMSVFLGSFYISSLFIV